MNVEQLKATFAAMMSMLLAFLHPISGSLHALFALFMADFLCGILADVIAHNARFQMKKALSFVRDMATFFGLVCFLFYLGKQMEKLELTLNLISYTTYVVFWAFGTNILRNLLLITPRQTPARKVLLFLYYVLSVEFVKDIPFLKDFINKKKEEEKENG